MRTASLVTVVREWGRIGCIGFGGPPTHIALLRELCVEQRAWIDDGDFEQAIVTTNLLPGPASTQLAIYCAWRVAGRSGAILGGLAFIIPGLVLIIALAALFLGSPPTWVLGAGAGAGAAVAAVAVHAGTSLMGPSRRQIDSPGHGRRWGAYLVAGAGAAALAGPWLVILLLGCGAIEVVWRRSDRPPISLKLHVSPLVVVAAAGAGGLAALCWTALKVGALSYGGGFVIIPLMQADAVDQHHWMTDGEFLNAVALGQVTPGPVVHTVAVVGYAAFGLGGALLAATVAFAPSFWFIALGAERFDRLRRHPLAQHVLLGAGPAAIGAIIGSSVPLTLALTDAWQYAILAGGGLLLFVARRGIVTVLITAGAAGVVAALLGARSACRGVQGRPPRKRSLLRRALDVSRPATLTPRENRSRSRRVSQRRVRRPRRPAR